MVRLSMVDSLQAKFRWLKPQHRGDDNHSAEALKEIPQTQDHGNRYIQAVEAQSHHVPDDLSGPIASLSTRRPPVPEMPPPPPEKILEMRDEYCQKLKSIPFYFLDPEAGEDWPLYGLYRIYEWVVVRNNVGIRNELETFWFNKWPIASIPDPEDHNEHSRYALLAAITAMMVRSYNRRIDLGIPRWADPILTDAEDEEAKKAPKVWETIPEWAKKVKALNVTLRIPHDNGQFLDSFDDPRVSPDLQEKNILCWQPDIHFI